MLALTLIRHHTVYSGFNYNSFRSVLRHPVSRFKKRRKKKKRKKKKGRKKERKKMHNAKPTVFHKIN